MYFDSFDFLVALVLPFDTDSVLKEIADSLCFLSGYVAERNEEL